jgi:hypothetical protein
VVAVANSIHLLALTVVALFPHVVPVVVAVLPLLFDSLAIFV